MFKFPLFVLIGIVCMLTDVSFSVKNGQNTTIEEWPFVCLLEKNGAFQCTCTIVSSDRVLTAASCVNDGNDDDYEVVYGVTSKENREDEIINGLGDRKKVKNIKGKNRYLSNSPYDNIVIIVLKSDIDWNSRVQPVDGLATSHDEHDCFVIGFGMLGAKVDSVQLQEAPQPVIDNCECTKRRVGEYPIAHEEVCTFDDKPKNEAARPCEGDNGAPLVCRKNNAWLLLGIFSRSKKDCKKTAVYTRINSYRDWLCIRQVCLKEEYDD